MTAQYETLRTAGLGEPLPPVVRSGLALLLRRGMWAWAQEAAAPCATARPPRSSRPCTSADDRQPAVVHLLAALAMRAPQRRPR